MFRLSFFGTFRSQRRSLEAATTFAPQTFNPALQSQIDLLEQGILPPSDTRSIWRGCLHASRPLLVRSALFSFLGSLLLVANVWITRLLLETAGQLRWVAFIALGYLVLEIGRYGLSYFDFRARAQLARCLQIYLFTRVNRKFLTLDPAVIGRDFTFGNLKTLVSADVDAVEDFVTAASQSWLSCGTLFLVMTPTIYLMAGWLGLLGVAVAVAQIPLSMALAAWAERVQSRSQRQLDRVTTLVGEWIRNIRLVRFLGWQGAFERDIAKGISKYSYRAAIGSMLVLITYGLSYSWWMLPILTILGATSWSNEPLGLAQFFGALWALTILTNQLQFIPYSISHYGPAAAAVKRLNEFLNLDQLDQHLLPGESSPPAGNPCRLILNNVIVRSGERIILGPINCELDLNEHIAIVGEVGSGKSTLLQVLIGERFPDQGEITVQFVTGERHPLWTGGIYEHFRSSLAFVPQQPFLSNTTVALNLDIWDDRPASELQSATARAQLDSDIESFQGAYKQEVGEVGINLSGGQKQRVSLARAFLSGRKLLVLDDPLSAVDQATERKLAEEIFTAGTGVLLVSHRLDELTRCSRVLVLEQGRIVEDGVPNILVNQPASAFRRFIEATQRRENADVAG